MRRIPLSALKVTSRRAYSPKGAHAHIIMYITLARKAPGTLYIIYTRGDRGRA